MLEPGGYSNQATVMVIEHKKPYVVLSLTGKDKGTFSNVGGRLEVKVPDAMLYDEASWK